MPASRARTGRTASDPRTGAIGPQAGNAAGARGSGVVHVTLPVPPSVNRIWRRAKQGGMYKVPEAVAYVWRALACFKAAGLRTTGDDPRFPRGDVAVVAVWHRKGQQGDLDNRLKLLLDAGTGVLWTDDKQVADIRIVRRAAEGVPRIELWVMPADAAPALTTEPRVA